MPTLSVTEWVVLAVASLLTSIVSTIAGVGGGAALVGVMASTLPSMAVVPVHGLVQLASNFTRVLAFRHHVQWNIYARVAPSLVVGAFIAREILSRFFAGEGLDFLRVVVGGFLLFFLLLRRVQPSVRTIPLWGYIPIAMVTGFVGIFVGAFGPFLAPFLLRDDLEKEEVIATGAACMGTGHLLKIPVFFSLGFPFVDWALLIGVCTAGVVVGTFVGKRLLHKLDAELFIRLVEALLFTLGLWLCGSWAYAVLTAAPAA